MTKRLSKLLENTEGKGELFIMSNFSFSLTVFKILLLQTRENQGLFWKGLTSYHRVWHFRAVKIYGCGKHCEKEKLRKKNCF